MSYIAVVPTDSPPVPADYPFRSTPVSAFLLVLVVAFGYISPAEAQSVWWPDDDRPPGAGCYTEWGLGPRSGPYDLDYQCVQICGQPPPPEWENWEPSEDLNVDNPPEGMDPTKLPSEICTSLGPNKVHYSYSISRRQWCTFRTGPRRPRHPIRRVYYPRGHPVCKKMKDDPHAETFDGVRYDLQAAGEFVGIEALDDDLEVQYRLATPGNRTDVSAITAVAARVGDRPATRRVAFYVEGDMPLRIDGEATPLEDGGVIPLTADTSAVLLRDDIRYTIVYPDGSNLHVDVLPRHLNAYFLAAEARDGRLTGLFGDGDGNPENDFRTRAGEVLASPPAFDALYQTFAESWRVRPEESLFDYGPSESTETFTDRSIPTAPATLKGLAPEVRARAKAACREAGITELSLLRNCTIDYGYTGDDSYVASAAAQQPPPEFLAASGERVLFEEDFSTDSVGSFPLQMSLVRGPWKIVEVEGRRLLHYVGDRNGAFVVNLPETLPERFTVSFDAHFPHHQIRLAVASSEPESGNLYRNNPRYPHHYAWVDPRSSGFEHRARGAATATSRAPQLQESLVPIRLELDGARAELYVAGERVATISESDFPRTDRLWFQSMNNVSDEHPMYLDNLRVAVPETE